MTCGYASLRKVEERANFGSQMLTIKSNYASVVFDVKIMIPILTINVSRLILQDEEYHSFCDFTSMTPVLLLWFQSQRPLVHALNDVRCERLWYWLKVE